MTFDIVIATRNRGKSLLRLINQIKTCDFLPNKIIVIDSSDEFMIDPIFDETNIHYIKCKRKNKPYQQFIGASMSDSECIIFMDDDMTILDNLCFKKIIDCLESNIEIYGVQPNFHYKNNFFDDYLPSSKTRKHRLISRISSLFRFIFCNINTREGEISFSGVKGPILQGTNSIQWFYGPVFAAKKEHIFYNLNATLFDIFDSDYGYGEDLLFGMTLSKLGKIKFLKEKLFLHDDSNESFFSNSPLKYAARVAYSRLFLSLEYARLYQKSILFALIHYNLNLFGRLIGVLFNQLISFDKKRNNIFKGYILGYVFAIRDFKKLRKLKTIDNYDF